MSQFLKNLNGKEEKNREGAPTDKRYVNYYKMNMFIVKNVEKNI